MNKRKKKLIVRIVVFCIILSIVWIVAGFRVMYDTLHLIEIDEYVMPATKIDGVQNVEDASRTEFIDDLEARYVEAEAGNQSIWGRRLVYAVLQNRLESSQFPDTVEEVLHQKNQFECVSNGSINRVTVSEETKEAIRQEMNSRSDSQVLYFTAGKYNPYCKPMYKYGDHYFGR